MVAVGITVTLWCSSVVGLGMAFSSGRGPDRMRHRRCLVREPRRFATSAVAMTDLRLDSDVADAGETGGLPRRGLSDFQLVVGVARGRSEALEALWVRHGGAVHGLALGLCGADQAKKVVHDVFWALWRTPEHYDPQQCSLRSYLLARTHELSVDLLRSVPPRRAQQIGAGPGDQGCADAEHEKLALVADGTVLRALCELSESTREAIVLAYFGAYTYGEVAVWVRQPEATVKSRIRSGLSELQTALDGR